MNLKTALKKIRPIHGLLVSLLLLLIIVPLNVYWNMDRIAKFQAWSEEYSLGQQFAFYEMDRAAGLVNTTNFQTNNTVQAWYYESLSSAFITLNQIAGIDSAHGTRTSAHGTQYFQMNEVLDSLRNFQYVNGLNATERSTLSKILYSVGNDILYAYSKYGDFGSPGQWSLSLSPYSGPSPPDDNLVNQAYVLLTTLPGLPQPQLP